MGKERRKGDERSMECEGSVEGSGIRNTVAPDFRRVAKYDVI